MPAWTEMLRDAPPSGCSTFTRQVYTLVVVWWGSGGGGGRHPGCRQDGPIAASLDSSEVLPVTVTQAVTTGGLDVTLALSVLCSHGVRGASLQQAVPELHDQCGVAGRYSHYSAWPGWRGDGRKDRRRDRRQQTLLIITFSTRRSAGRRGVLRDRQPPPRHLWVDGKVSDKPQRCLRGKASDSYQENIDMHKSRVTRGETTRLQHYEVFSFRVRILNVGQGRCRPRHPPETVSTGSGHGKREAKALMNV
ncbi:hypothetical protein E2C01_033223 [Portunus trituberculatus]|uniref:Uncharacterized protein n=1 Tax=Portunus trituberculatus TaxID=210409 RepID=A0A5B7F3G0_PORTR|nr:hypothetical protein [Portunus trituberculatus]